MVPVITGGRSELQSIGRVNVVGVLVLFVSLAIGVAATVATSNPVPLLVMAPVGLILMLSPRVAQQCRRKADRQQGQERPALEGFDGEAEAGTAPPGVRCPGAGQKMQKHESSLTCCGEALRH